MELEVFARKWALIPNKGGTITLPEISVAGGDVTNNNLRTAVIPSKEIQVETAVGSDKKIMTPEVTVEPVKAKKSIVVQESADVIKASMTWKIMTIVFAILWIGTILNLVYQ